MNKDQTFSGGSGQRGMGHPRHLIGPPWGDPVILHYHWLTAQSEARLFNSLMSASHLENVPLLTSQVGVPTCDVCWVDRSTS